MRKFFIYISLLLAASFVAYLILPLTNSSTESKTSSVKDKTLPVANKILPIENKINWAKDFNSAIVRAKKENKPVMFVISRHTCKYCVILEKTTFSNKEFISYLNKNFVAVISYTDENDYIPRSLQRPGTPSTWFLKSSGEPMYLPLVGAVDAKNFLNALTIIKEEFDNMKGNGK